MKNIIIKLSCILLTVFCQFLSASDSGSSDSEQNTIDVSLVLVSYFHALPEDGVDNRPFTPAAQGDAQHAQAVLQEAIESGDVEVNPGERVSLTYDRQTGETVVTIESADGRSALVDTISRR